MPQLDFIAVGLGPFNLSLACMLAPLKDVRGLFLERSDRFDWHPGMLVERCTLQNPFLADLVTLADPTSRFSYLNYARHQGRLYACCVRENLFITRHDYNRYCQWAADQLDSVRFGHEVDSIRHDPASGLYIVSGRERPSGRRFTHEARRLVIGVGSSPVLPACCQDGADYPHSGDYLRLKPQLQAGRSITVVGSGQSAAEVCWDLLQDIDRHGYRLNWVTGAARFFRLENAKLVLELVSPDYADHFHSLADDVKDRVVAGQASVYKGINVQLINQIYDLLDEHREDWRDRVRLLPAMSLQSCRRSADGGWDMAFRHTETDRRFRHRSDGLVLATGYAPQVPRFIDGIRERIGWDAQGRYRQHRNYAVDLQGDEVFVQNAGCHSFGVTNPDLGLACHRNAWIIRALTGVEHYRIESGTTVQDFHPRGDATFEEIDPRAVRSLAS